MTDRAEKLLEILADVLSFDRPGLVTTPEMVAESRDVMAAWGYPAQGDGRPLDVAQVRCRQRWQHRPLPDAAVDAWEGKAEMSKRAVTREVLQGVKALLAAPSNWCQGTWAQDAHGVDISPVDQRAASWSLAGAIKHLNGIGEGGTAWAIIALEMECDSGLQWWNDAPDRTYDDVIDLLDRTIRGACDKPFQTRTPDFSWRDPDLGMEVALGSEGTVWVAFYPVEGCLRPADAIAFAAAIRQAAHIQQNADERE